LPTIENASGSDRHSAPRELRGPRPAHVVHPAQALPEPDERSRDVDLPAVHAMPGKRRECVMRVVPGLTERQESKRRKVLGSVARFTALTPVLIVVELMISGGAGEDLCRTFKAQSEAPVVAVSTLVARDDALLAGADVFLSKPLNRVELLSAVNDLLGQSTSVAGVPATSEHA
jgi:CheY-like chemotaxis protein